MMMATFRTRTARRMLIGLSTALLLFVLFIIGLPELMRYGATQLLERQGTGQTTIEDIDFNPFTGAFVLRRLQTASGLVLNHVKLHLAWWALWRHRLVITHLHGNTITLTVTRRPDGTLNIDGITLPASSSQPAAAGPAWHVDLPSVDFSGIKLRLQLPADKGVSARTIQVALADLYLDHLSLTSAGLKLAELRLDGLQTKDSAGIAPKSVRRLQLFDLQADSKQQQLKLGSANILDVRLAPPAPLQGGSIGHITAQKLAMTAAGTIRAGQIRINAITLPERDGTRLGSLASLEVNGLKGKAPEQLSAKKIALQRLTLPADKTQALGRIGGIRIGELQATPRQAEMTNLTIDDLDCALRRGTNGNLMLPPLPFVSTAGAPTKATATTTPPAKAMIPPFSLHIGTLALTGNNRLALRDESVKPVFKTDIVIRRFNLAPLALGPAKAGQFDAAFTLDQQADITAHGSLTPDPARFAVNVIAAVRRLSLPRFSSYIEHAVGISIQTGQLDLDNNTQIAAGALQAQNHLYIRNLQVGAGGNAPAVSGIPINTALDMIRSDNGDIDLNLPLHGPLNDLQANISDVINKALMKALQKAALYYASQYLYPYGTLISVASTAAKLAAAPPRLTPIRFAPASGKLDTQANAYAEKIAELLKAKKGIRLQVCGVATPAEFAANKPLPDDEHLLDLAQRRSTSVVDAIAKHGISTDRLFSCKPDIDRSANAGGRVELLLQ